MMVHTVTAPPPLPSSDRGALAAMTWRGDPATNLCDCVIKVHCSDGSQKSFPVHRSVIAVSERRSLLLRQQASDPCTHPLHTAIHECEFRGQIQQQMCDVDCELSKEVCWDVAALH